ncbi:MAG: ClpX C4-type zinc finger protein [Actinomycetota bacterium]|nr:ClpX C4-type zinc finger protein [Actinomycetota bacterium]
MSPQQERQAAVEERCSLCGDARDQVEVLVEGFEGLYVCDDCIAVLTELLDEARAQPHTAPVAA